MALAQQGKQLNDKILESFVAQGKDIVYWLSSKLYPKSR